MFEFGQCATPEPVSDEERIDRMVRVDKPVKKKFRATKEDLEMDSQPKETDDSDKANEKIQLAAKKLTLIVRTLSASDARIFRSRTQSELFQKTNKYTKERSVILLRESDGQYTIELPWTPSSAVSIYKVRGQSLRLQTRIIVQTQKHGRQLSINLYTLPH